MIFAWRKAFALLLTVAVCPCAARAGDSQTPRKMAAVARYLMSDRQAEIALALFYSLASSLQ